MPYTSPIPPLYLARISQVEKITVPGLKRAFRLYNSTGCPVADHIGEI